MSFSVKLFSSPSDFASLNSADLSEQFANISARATGGKLWREYQPGIDGWRDYFTGKGGRPEEYDRLVVIYSESKIVHFTAIKKLKIESWDVYWTFVSITHPEFQKNSLLGLAMTKLFDIDWLKQNGNAFYICRTPNPIVYESFRQFSFLIEKLGFNSSFYPKIVSSDQIEAPSSSVCEFAHKVAKMISPECEFSDIDFVIRGYYKKYGFLYKEHYFKSNNKVVNSYIKNILDHDNQDGILLINEVTPNDL